MGDDASAPETWTYANSTPDPDSVVDGALYFTAPTADEMGDDAVWAYTATARDSEGLVIGSTQFYVYNSSVLEKEGYSQGGSGSDGVHRTFQLFRDAAVNTQYYAFMLSPDYGKVFDMGESNDLNAITNHFEDFSEVTDLRVVAK